MERASVAPQSFDILSAHDWLAKLERELERIKLSDDRESLIDHCINFALTAWHLADWVWMALKSDALAFGAAAKTCGVATDQLSFKAFKAHVSGSNGSQALWTCQLIATSSKHVGNATKASMQARVMPQQPREFRITRDIQADGTPIVLMRARWEAEILVDGLRHPAPEIFTQVVAYWKGFIRDHHLA